MVAAYVRAGAPDKHGSCHLFRHTTATLMLDAGADVRYVGEMLGHREARDHDDLHPGLGRKSCAKCTPPPIPPRAPSAGPEPPAAKAGDATAPGWCSCQTWSGAHHPRAEPSWRSPPSSSRSPSGAHPAPCANTPKQPRRAPQLRPAGRGPPRGAESAGRGRCDDPLLSHEHPAAQYTATTILYLQFLSVDPNVEATSEPYSYAGDNPVHFSDPFGLSPNGSACVQF